MDQFTQAYIKCALWSSSEGEKGEILLDEYDGDIAPATLARMSADCAAFQQTHTALLEQWYELGQREDYAGHDFWLTRNGHGAGFWDRFSDDQSGGAIGKALTDAAHAYGEAYLYIGDDGQIHIA